MAAVVDTLTEDHCKEVLRKHLNTDNFQLLSFKAAPFSSTYEGLIGEHYHLDIDYNTLNDEPKTQRFFLKTLNRNEVMTELSTALCMFEKERFFYNDLLPEFHKYNINCSFSPRGYLFRDSLVVLEDLALAGYKGTDKRKPLDLEHCKTCLDNLAQFHAATIIYEDRKKADNASYRLVDQFPDMLHDKVFSSSGDNSAVRYFKCSMQGLFLIIDQLPPQQDIDNDRFKTELWAALDDLIHHQDSDLDATVLHADLWSNNFLFWYEDNVPVRCKLIDYQTVRYGPYQMDLLQFIYSNTRKEFRDGHLTELVRHYRHSLNKLVLEAQVKSFVVPPDEEFLESCRAFKLPAMIFAVIDRSITFLSDEIFGEALKTNDSFRRFIFDERGKYIVDSFQRDEAFRNLLTEDLEELRKMLFD